MHIKVKVTPWHARAGTEWMRSYTPTHSLLEARRRWVVSSALRPLYPGLYTCIIHTCGRREGEVGVTKYLAIQQQVYADGSLQERRRNGQETRQRGYRSVNCVSRDDFCSWAARHGATVEQLEEEEEEKKEEEEEEEKKKKKKKKRRQTDEVSRKMWRHKREVKAGVASCFQNIMKSDEYFKIS